MSKAENVHMKSLEELKELASTDRIAELKAKIIERSTLERIIAVNTSHPDDLAAVILRAELLGEPDIFPDLKRSNLMNGPTLFGGFIRALERASVDFYNIPIGKSERIVDRIVKALGNMCARDEPAHETSYELLEYIVKKTENLNIPLADGDYLIRYAIMSEDIRTATILMKNAVDLHIGDAFFDCDEYAKRLQDEDRYGFYPQYLALRTQQNLNDGASLPQRKAKVKL